MLLKCFPHSQTQGDSSEDSKRKGTPWRGILLPKFLEVKSSQYFKYMCSGDQSLNFSQFPLQENIWMG